MDESEAPSLVTRIIASALELPADRVEEGDTIETVKEWDSLGHLNILTALDKHFSGKVGRIPELARATSVKRIIEILHENRLI